MQNLEDAIERTKAKHQRAIQIQGRKSVLFGLDKRSIGDERYYLAIYIDASLYLYRALGLNKCTSDEDAPSYIMPKSHKRIWETGHENVNFPHSPISACYNRRHGS